MPGSFRRLTCGADRSRSWPEAQPSGGGALCEQDLPGSLFFREVVIRTKLTILSSINDKTRHKDGKILVAGPGPWSAADNMPRLRQGDFITRQTDRALGLRRTLVGDFGCACGKNVIVGTPKNWAPSEGVEQVMRAKGLLGQVWSAEATTPTLALVWNPSLPPTDAPPKNCLSAGRTASLATVLGAQGELDAARRIVSAPCSQIPLRTRQRD